MKPPMTLLIKAARMVPPCAFCVDAAVLLTYTDSADANSVDAPMMA